VTALATFAWVMGIFLWARTSRDRFPADSRDNSHSSV